MAVPTVWILIKFVTQLLSGLYKYVILYASIFLGVLLRSQRYPEQIDTTEVPNFDSTDYWPRYGHSREIGRMRWPYIWTGNKLQDSKSLGTVTHSVPVTQRESEASFHPLITWIYPNVKCRMDWFFRKPYTCLLFNFQFVKKISANRTCLTSVNMYVPKILMLGNIKSMKVASQPCHTLIFWGDLKCRSLTAAGLVQSVKRLTAEREVASSIPGVGPLLRVLK